MAACREPYEPDALRAFGPPTADLSAERVQRHRVPGVERVAEYARLHANLAEPAGDWLGFVASMFGVPASRQDDQVRAGHRRVHRPSYHEVQR
jgi:hypothetical protein